jgi:predicted DNA-binding ribbon-helix-helix protein
MSSLINRNVRRDGKRTSMRLEPQSWDAVRDICHREKIAVDELISRAVRSHPNGRRTSAVRVFILMYYRALAHASADLTAAVHAEMRQAESEPVEYRTDRKIVN